jgi:predicted phage terminase large subunit-like protein
VVLAPFSLEEVRLEQAERCKKSLRYFFQQAWKVMEPGTPLLWGWHLDAIVEHLEAVIRGDIRRLVCNLAPGHAKSTMFSVALPAWVWTFMPTSRWLCASYSLDLAMRDNSNCRYLIASEWYQSLFGNTVQVKVDQDAKGFFENTRRGYRICTSVGSKGGTGKRGTHLLIDDSNDSKATQFDLEETIRWYGRTWMSRLNDIENGAMICVGQRMHQRDLTGHLLDLGGWEHLCLPTEYEPSRKCHTSLGWSDPRTVEGELLWPQKFTPGIVHDLKRSMGSTVFAAQYQQLPMPAGGGQFQKKWFRYFSTEDDYYTLETPEGVKRILRSKCWTFATIDLAVSLKQTADYTVIGIWAVTPERDLLLVDRLRERLDNPEQQKQIALWYRRYNPDYLKVESVAYQLSLVQQLRLQGLPVKEYRPVRDKVSRATTASVYYEAGKVYHPKHASWLSEWEEEMLMFPLGTHDDQVDVCSQACEELGMPQASGGMISMELDEDVIGEGWF